MTTPRSSIKTLDTWDLDPLYPSIKDWEEDYAQICSGDLPFQEILELKGTIKNGPQALKKVLSRFFEIDRALRKLYTWAHLASDVEMTVEETRSAYSRIQASYHLFGQAVSWIEPEILALDEKQLSLYLQADDLRDYTFYLERLVRMKPHTLTEREEELIALAEEPLSKVYGTFRLFNDADLKFPDVADSEGNKHPLTHATYSLYLRSKDRILRKNTFTTLHEKYREFENTLAELLSGQAQKQIFSAKSRKYTSALECTLFPKNIPESVYTNLISSVHQEIGTLHNYLDLKRRVLQLDELHLYDVYSPMFPSIERTFTFDEANQLVIDSVAPLGEAYQKTLAEGLQSKRWVDRFENLNKRSGAYSSGCYDSYPYILMNFTGKLRDVFTLAHEAGHSMHSYLSHKMQPYHYSDYPIFVAEVASTFNEELLLNHLLKTSKSPEERAYLLSEKLEDVRATLFRQTMFAEFEKTIHERLESRNPITPGYLKSLFIDLNRRYFGPNTVIDEEVGSEWSRIPHFYYHFYVYQYATGISAAMALANDVLAKTPKSQEKYLEFLSSGSIDYPIALLKRAGVDMESQKPVVQAIGRFKQLTDQLEKELLALGMLKC